MPVCPSIHYCPAIVQFPRATAGNDSWIKRAALAAARLANWPNGTNRMGSGDPLFPRRVPMGARHLRQRNALATPLGQIERKTLFRRETPG
jgi:hypothetical protein